MQGEVVGHQQQAHWINECLPNIDMAAAGHPRADGSSSSLHKNQWETTSCELLVSLNHDGLGCQLAQARVGTGFEPAWVLCLER